MMKIQRQEERLPRPFLGLLVGGGDGEGMGHTMKVMP